MVPPKKTERLKNYRSQASETSIFEAIRKALATHKARRITFDSDDEGQAIGIEFSVVVQGTTLAFRLPVRLDNAAKLVKQSYVSLGRGISKDALRDQAYRTAWANIRDWIEAQCALIDIGMVRTEEVFLPYLLNQEGKTYFEAFENAWRCQVPKAAATQQGVGSSLMSDEAMDWYEGAD
ncbi:MAG: hypothetical protein IVW53_15570 [Chloroflexi bacterium]|nr:hypothetical protein [Chloroflexota bacterium]